MNELEAITEAAQDARERGLPALLATVVGVRGSAYRRPGARMLLTPEGWRAGSVSGGCLEGDIVRKAWWRTESGKPVLLTYDSTVADGDDDLDANELSWGFGLGCNGVVEILLERLTPGDTACPVAFIADCLRRDCSGVVATVVGGDAQVERLLGQRLLWRDGDERPVAVTIEDVSLSSQAEREAFAFLTGNGAASRTFTMATAEGFRADLYVERISPPTPLLICGAGHDAAPLARLAKTLGWRVTVLDPRAGMTPRLDRFWGADMTLACAPRDLGARVALDARTVVVVMSHNVALDAALLAVLLPSPVRYIGVLGPRRRTERLLESLGESARLGDNRLHGPVGLNIGADNPETIALSILAEIQAFMANRDAGFLRDSDRPIHAPLPAPSGEPPANLLLSSAPRTTDARETFVCDLVNASA